MLSHNGRWRFTFLALLVLAVPGTVFALDESKADTLADLSLEELTDVQVISVSRRPEGAFYVAAPVYVLSNEDIRRSGATSIPEALRMVPGLNVSRIDMNHYIISGSTNNDYFTEKVLVLIDGRPLQSQTFSQVWWPAVMYPLEDIERIEVIRGAGSAQWGANAMNAVINIITKSARQTESGLLSGGGGGKETAFGTARTGWRAENGISARVYAMGNESGGAHIVRAERSPNPRDGGPQDNYKKAYQAGFRMDGEGVSSRYTVHGDTHRVSAMAEGASFVGLDWPGTKHYVFEDVYQGDNILGRYEKDENAALNWSVQLSWDHQSVHRIYFDEQTHAFGAEAQANWRTGANNQLTLGVTGRVVQEGFEKTMSMDKPSVTTDEAGIFANDELMLMGDRLKLSAGVKAERNSYAGWQWQPGVRASWDEERWMVWGAATKTSRLPNNANNHLTWVTDFAGIQGPDGNNHYLLGIVTAKGGVAPENLYAYEAGARARPSQNLSFDITGFYNQYDNIVSLDAGQDPYLANMYGQTLYVYDIYYLNCWEGLSYGGTVSLDWKPLEWMRVFGGYTYTRIKMDLKPEQPLTELLFDFGNYMAGSTPLYSFKGGVFADLPYRLQANATGYYVDSMEALSVGEYFRLDLQVAWHPTDRLEIAAVGRNLTRHQHAEWYSPWTLDNAWVNQDYFVKVTYRF